MRRIEFEFATQDDCLDKMVPSDLRMLVKQRDEAEKENRVLKGWLDLHDICKECGCGIRDTALGCDEFRGQ